jgi:hypothetical protein
VEIENIELVGGSRICRKTQFRGFSSILSTAPDATKTIGQLCKKETVLEKNKQNFGKKKCGDKMIQN